MSENCFKIICRTFSIDLCYFTQYTRHGLQICASECHSRSYPSFPNEGQRGRRWKRGAIYHSFGNEW